MRRRPPAERLVPVIGGVAGRRRSPRSSAARQMRDYAEVVTPPHAWAGRVAPEHRRGRPLRCVRRLRARDLLASPGTGGSDEDRYTLLEIDIQGGWEAARAGSLSISSTKVR